MKKTFTFITAFAFALSCVSCSQKNDSKEKVQSFSVEKIDNIAYWCYTKKVDKRKEKGYNKSKHQNRKPRRKNHDKETAAI